MISADIIIIGAGPAGLETASQALRQGKDVVIIERSQLGGTCLNLGCIPSKALYASSQTAEAVKSAAEMGVEIAGTPVPSYAKAALRKDSVVESLRQGVAASLQKAHVVEGEAKLLPDMTVEAAGETYTAPQIVIATGSEPSRLPIPGAELALTSDDVLKPGWTAPADIVIIGGGVIGMEIACILNSFGTQVTVVEYAPEILPSFDREIAKRLRSLLQRKGIKIAVGAAATEIRQGMEVDYTCKGKTQTVKAGAVLMAVGRRPVCPVGLSECGIALEGRAIRTDDSFATSAAGIYAVGDVNGRLMLAHAAEAQAAMMMGHDGIRLDTVPADAFTSPECAMVGLTEEQCAASGLRIKTAKSLFRANGKACAMGETDGFVKVIAEQETGRLLGCHIIGPHASDLIQEAAQAIASGQTAADVADTIHAHPTLSEVVMQAMRAVAAD